MCLNIKVIKLYYMFLVDKYNNYNNISLYKNIIKNLINTNKSILFKNDDLSNFNNILFDVNTNNEINNDSNFQHLIIYGPVGSGKIQLVNTLLEHIFGKNSIELKDVEYNISSYSNTKTKIMIKQSKNHIIIEPNTNGFDKYLIQEIIQYYAKSKLLNIIKDNKLYKVVIINKIDNLSYYAQASLRRTMEKYSDTCKFILISDQLTKIIEPIRSRCLLVRVPLPSDFDIMEILMHVSHKENIEMNSDVLFSILKESDNKISTALWLLDAYRYNIEYKKDWEIIINDLVNIIINYDNYKLYNIIKNFREQFYILFITNIPTQLIIRKMMLLLLKNTNDLKLKYNIINITSIFEQRISQGTRHIIHMEAYIIRLIYLFINYNKGIDYNYNLDVLEI
jgi:replication factor C subunit 3/5